jgi:hypothetical protein
MRLEAERALRHGYPISCLMLGLDGFLDAGLLLKRKIVMPLVFGELKAVTYGRDVRGLGIWTEGFQLAVFPHLAPDDVEELAEELLQRARRIEHADVPAEADVSLSIGISHNLHPGEVSFESLVEEAETGMSMAQAAGGDRVARWREVETELDRLKEELEEQLDEIRRVSESVFAGTLAAEELWGRNLVGKVIARFSQEADASAAAVRLQTEVVALLRAELADFRRTSSASQLMEAQTEIERLERRVSKLTGSLGRTETELRKLAEMKGVDLGVASIYRTVQGLRVDDDHFEAKQEILKNIFEANFALRAEMAKKA